MRKMCPYKNDELHLHACMHWLVRAQDIGHGHGISDSYWPLNDKWSGPSIRNLGSLIVTFIKYSVLYNKANFKERAIALGDILLKHDFIDGEEPIGVECLCQMIEGLLYLYDISQKSKFRDMAIRIGDYIIEDRERNHISNILYNVTILYSLLKLNEVVDGFAFKELEDAFVEMLARIPDGKTVYYNITTDNKASAKSDLVVSFLWHYWRSANLINNKDILSHNIVVAVAQDLMNLYERRKKKFNFPPDYFPGLLSMEGRACSSWSDLAASAQLATLWMNICIDTGDALLMNSSLKIIDQLKKVQCMNPLVANLHGAIPEFFPRHAKSMNFSFSVCAVRNFADALMCVEEAMEAVM